MVAEVRAMEQKKAKLQASDLHLQKKAQEFVADVKAEVQKITWTEKNELFFYTKLVVGATFFVGMTIYLWDLFVQATLTSLHFILRFITG